MYRYNVYDYETDEMRFYRRDEISDRLYAVMERVRIERLKEVPWYAVDRAIRLQNERSIVTAVNYIRYFLLHELRWLDVFGEAAYRYDAELAHYEQCKAMELKIDKLTGVIEEMSEQIGAMQDYIVRLAGEVNRTRLKRAV